MSLSRIENKSGSENKPLPVGDQNEEGLLTVDLNATGIANRTLSKEAIKQKPKGIL